MKPYSIFTALFFVFAQISTAADVNLAWDAVTSPTLAGYQIGYGTTSGQHATLLDVGNVTNSTVSIAVPGTYYFGVRAYGTGGEQSAYSNEVSTTIAAPGDTTPPVISAVGSSSVTVSSAAISWSTNEASDSQIEYGLTSSYGSSTVLNTSLVTSHSQSLSGLAAGTMYHFRVKSKDAAGNLSVSGDFTFTTLVPSDTTAPVITAVASSGVTASAATITWTTNEASDTQVEYGPTTSYGTSTALVTSMVTSHSRGLSGLTSATTYHYRVKSKDAAGNLATSSDYTFTTSDTTAPVISAVASSGVTASAATITWTTNEASDTQVEYGPTTSYGTSTALVTSMVTSHSRGLSGLTSATTYHYRVKSKDAAGNLATSSDYMFTTSDTTAPVISAVAGSGLTATTATITWTTNEVSDTQVEYGPTTSYGTSTTLNTSLVLSHSQGLSGLTSATTYHFRVKSKDAVENLATSSDYTFTTSDTTAPVISAVASSGVTASAATITWTTNEASDTQVEYGPTTSYGTSTTLNTSLVTSHSQGLSGLTSATTYHYRVKSKDAAGNLAVSSDYTFTASDTTAPVITAVASSGVTASAATITWTTNEASDTQVEYGPTTSYGTSTTLNTLLVTSHSQGLSGLTSTTTYHYRVKSKDAAGNLAVSSDYTFTGSDTTAPVITAVASSGVTASAATITWTTNEASDTQVEYGLTTSYGTSTTLNTLLVTSHSQGLSGLTSGTTYHYRVKSKDATSNLATSSDYTFTTSDTTAPVISAVASSGVTATTATITWTTNEASDTQVEYGPTTSYGTSTTPVTSMVTSHSQGLSGLTSATTYHYRVKSKDAAGNLAVSSDYTFTASDTTAPVISAVASSAVTATTATITWTTNETSDTQVEYGPTTSYGTLTTLVTSMVTSHSRGVSGLTSATTYHFRVKSKDAAGNLASSSDYTFISSDTTAPVISAVASSAVTATTATITWTTNEASDTQVEYGPTTSYGTSTALVTSLVTSHSQGVSGLTSATTYHFRVKSKDAAGNLAVSSDYMFTTSSGVDITTGLTAAFAFDEGNGYSSTDLSGNGNDASIHSAIWTAGKYGRALAFNGRNSYVSAGIARIPGVNQPKTISCWIYLPTFSWSSQSILALANPALNSSVQYGRTITKTGVLDFGNTWMLVAKLPSLRQWHHLAYVFDGSMNRFYINGVLASTSTVMPAAGAVTKFEIGRWITGSKYFNGSVDDVRIYNRALSVEELSAVMITPVGSTTGSPDSEDAVALSSMEELALPTETTEPPEANPVIDVQLAKRNYRQGETIRITSFRVANSSIRSREVELKAWMEIPGMLPVSLDLSVEDTLDLSPGLDQDYGAMPLLNISSDAPAGSGEVNARLIDPVTGNILSEDINPFTIASSKKASSKTGIGTLSPRVTLQDLAVDSRPQYMISNTGSEPAAVELKIWLESKGGGAIPLISVGADGSLVLNAGVNLTLDPLATVQIPEGAYTIHARLIDAASGRLLSETASN